jgi:hypothetical protein
MLVSWIYTGIGMRGFFHLRNVTVVGFYYLFNCYMFRFYDHLQAEIYLLKSTLLTIKILVNMLTRLEIRE